MNDQIALVIICHLVVGLFRLKSKQMSASFCENLMRSGGLQEAVHAEKNKEAGSSLGMGSLDDPLIQNPGVSRDHSVNHAPPPLHHLLAMSCRP